MRPDFSWNIQSIVLTQPHLEKDQTRVHDRQVPTQSRSVRHRAHRNTVFFEVAGHHFAHRRIAINDNDVAGFGDLRS